MHTRTVNWMITSIIRPHRMHALMHRCGLLLQMNRGLSVCLSVSVTLTHNLSCAESDEQTEMPFGAIRTRVSWT